MKLIKRPVCEAQLNGIARLMLNPEDIINLERSDLEEALTGKIGVLYVARQEGEEMKQFMESFLDALSNTPDVIDCQFLVLSIAVSENDSLTFEDTDIIHEFLGKLKNDNVETRWGIHNSPTDYGMMIALCTNDL